MSQDQKNSILYIGRDEEYATTLADILQYHDSEFQVETLTDLENVKTLTQNNNFGAFIT